MYLLAMHPVLPARNFSLSLDFYSALGFDVFRHSDTVAELKRENCSFILQDRFDRQWAENSIMHVTVGDLYAFWKHIDAIDLMSLFSIPPITPPVLEHWGQVMLYMRDPSGVCWQYAEAGRCKRALSITKEEDRTTTMLRIVRSA